MNRNDFGIDADSNGYMIHYKGKPIGGAGVKLPRQNRLSQKQARDNIKQFLQSARTEIESLVAGKGSKYIRTEIKKIDKGGK